MIENTGFRKLDKRKLEALACMVEAPRSKRPCKAIFDMSSVYKTDSCGTAACLLGLAAVHWGFSSFDDYHISEMFGLSHEQRSNLFMPNDWEYAGPYAEKMWMRKAAAKTIRKLVRTGVVDYYWLNDAIEANTRVNA